MTIVFFLDVYYCIIIAWTLFYLISTFVNIPNVPWKGCGWLINRSEIKFLHPIPAQRRGNFSFFFLPQEIGGIPRIASTSKRSRKRPILLIRIARIPLATRTSLFIMLHRSRNTGSKHKVFTSFSLSFLFLSSRLELSLLIFHPPLKIPSSD